MLSHVRLFANPWTAAHQASLSITNSQSPLKLISIALVMSSNHLILCHPLLLKNMVSLAWKLFMWGDLKKNTPLIWYYYAFFFNFTSDFILLPEWLVKGDSYTIPEEVTAGKWGRKGREAQVLILKKQEKKKIFF